MLPYLPGGVAACFASRRVAARGERLRTHSSYSKAFALDGVADGLMTYILFWTLVYNVVHLF